MAIPYPIPLALSHSSDSSHHLRLVYLGEWCWRVSFYLALALMTLGELAMIGYSISVSLLQMSDCRLSIQGGENT